MLYEEVEEGLEKVVRLAKTWSPARAFYNGVLGGFILGISLAFLVVLYVYSATFPIPPVDYYGAFILFIIGIIVMATDAHKVTSARPS